MREQKRFRVAFLFILLLVGGCNSGGQPAPATGSVAPSPSGAPGTAGTNPTATPTSMIYPTEVEATATLTVTATGTPAPTRTPTALPPTWTSKPTLPPDEAQALVMDLIATNGGCRLPCWWGITPGETTWEEARTFLETFAAQILTISKDVYGVTYNNLPESVSRGAVGATITVDNGIVQKIRVDVYYPLSEMLQVYGQPNEVWIKVDPQSINPEAPTTIALFYADQGILAGYEGTTQKGKILRFCPAKIIDQRLWFLWNPMLDFTFQSAGHYALINRPFFKLEDKTNMDVMAFYDTYKDPGNASICFEMPDPTR